MNLESQRMNVVNVTSSNQQVELNPMCRQNIAKINGNLSHNTKISQLEFQQKYEEVAKSNKLAFNIIWNKKARQEILCEKPSDLTKHRIDNKQNKPMDMSVGSRQKSILLSCDARKDKIKAPDFCQQKAAPKRKDLVSPTDSQKKRSEEPVYVSEPQASILVERNRNLYELEIEQQSEPEDMILQENSSRRLQDIPADCLQDHGFAIEVMASNQLEAISVLKDSLVAVSELLNLNVKTDLATIDIRHVSEAFVAELAEIIYCLKNISVIIEEAMEKSKPISIRGLTFEAAQLPQIEQSLRVEIFRIEVALKTMGVAQMVQMKIAEKTDAFFDTKLAKALNPDSLAMPSSQLMKVFGQLLGIQPDMETQLRKLVELVRRQNETLMANPVILQPKTLSSSATYFDTIPLRSLFGAEVAEKILNENLLAASQNEQLGLPRIFDIPIARGPQQLLFKLKESVTLINPVSASAGSKAELMLMALESKTTQTALNTLEESVIRQISQKLQEVLRNGLNEIKLTLKPETLGEVRIKIQMEGDIVSAKILVENQQVKQIIESNFQSLKNALSQQNLQTGEFQVNISGQDASDAWEAFDNSANKNHNEKQTADVKDYTDASNNTSTSGIGNDTGRRYGNNTIEYYA